MSKPLQQGVKRDSVGSDGRSAFWHARYTLRPAPAQRQEDPPPTAPGATPAHRPYSATAAAAFDVPSVLAPLQEVILNTGEDCAPT